MRQRAKDWLNWVVAGGSLAFVLTLTHWHVPMRALLTWVSPGWALYLVLMGGALFGLGSVFLGNRMMTWQKPDGAKYAYMYLACAAIYAWFALSEIQEFHRTPTAAVLGNMLFFAYTFGLFLGIALTGLHRLYERRVTLRS